MIFTLFFGNSLRASELLNLEISDLDLARNRIQILGKGKNNKQWVSISLGTRDALAHWLNVRGSESDYVFIKLDRAKKTQGRISLDGICENIKRIGADCGLALVPHKIRYSSISAALNHKNVQGEIADLITGLLD